MKKNNKDKFIKLFPKLTKDNRNNIINLMNGYNIKRISIEYLSLLFIATFSTFILEMIAVYVIQGSINGCMNLSIIILFILPIVYSYVLTYQYSEVGRNIIYEILNTLKIISLIPPISILLSLLVYLFFKQAMFMVILVSISIMIPIIVITAQAFIVTIDIFIIYIKSIWSS